MKTTRPGARGVALILLCACLTAPAMAWNPAGWHYMNFPYIYSTPQASHFYFNTDSTWVVNLDTGRWWRMGASSLRSSWVYFNWPYAYCHENRDWYFIAQNNPAHVFSFQTDRWYRFGEVPDGYRENATTRFEVGYTGGDPAAQVGAYHYDLYLPSGYYDNPHRFYPCLFIADPGGNATMGTMQSWLQGQRWIVVMLVESRNGPWGPIYGNFYSAHDDVIKRLRVDMNKRVATGFSGGARASSEFVDRRKGFHGLILQGAGFSYGPGLYDESNVYGDQPGLRVFATFGHADGNLYERDMIRSHLAPAVNFDSEVFSGGHQWAPSATIQRALNWISVGM